MSTDEMETRRLPRRDLLRLAGVSGLAVAAGVVGARPLMALAASAGEDTPEGFLGAAYAQRARAMATGDDSLLDQIYNPARATLRTFEKDRARFFHAGIGPLWNGVVLDYASTVALLDLQLAGTTATARLYETVSMTWVPQPAAIPPAIAKRRQRDPAKYQSVVPRGPRGEIVATLGTRHEVMLTQATSGWRIVRDSYDEVCLGHVSPDLVPGSWPDIHGRGSVGGAASAAPAVASGSVTPLTQYSYNYLSAASYAKAHCGSGSYNNGTYCSWKNCGTDCANFVSQCFQAGSERTDGTWYSNYGSCPCGGSGSPGSGQVGSAAWVNNGSLRNWVLNTGRGTSWGDVYSLGIGDIINYDWNNDGTFDHVAIVTDSGGSTIVCCHTNDICNAGWQLGGAPRYGFTEVYSLYNA